MATVINATAADFSEVVLKSSLPVLVDFWAPWCRPCQMMAPILDELAVELDGKLTVVKVDVDEPENVSIGQEYQIMSIPNMKLFKNGVVIKEIVGLRPKGQIVSEIQGELQ